MIAIVANSNKRIDKPEEVLLSQVTVRMMGDDADDTGIASADES